MTIGELVAKLTIDTGAAFASLDAYSAKLEKQKQQFTRMQQVGTALMGSLVAGTVLLATSAGKADAAMSSFMRNFGEAASQNISQLRAASQGTVSDYDLMLNANKAYALGVTHNINDLIPLLQVAREKGIAMGEDTTQAFQDLVTGIGRGSPLILDNLGIRIPESIRKAGDSMSDAQKRQMLLNTVIQDGATTIQKYGITQLSAAERVQQATASFDNMKNTVGEALVPVLEELINIGKPIIQMIGSFAKSNPAAIQQFVKLGVAVGGVLLVTGTLGKAIPMVNAFFIAIKTGALTSQLSLGLVGIALIAITKLFIDAYQEESNLENKTSDTSNSLTDMGKIGNIAGDNIAQGMNDAGKAIEKVQKMIQRENEDFDQQMGEIIRRRQESLQNNKQTLEQETKDFKSKQDEQAKTYQSSLSSMKKANEQRIKDLEISMGETLNIGSDTYDKDLANFQQQSKDVQAENDSKIQKLQEDYGKEVSDAQSAFDEKTSALQKSIAEDESFLDKHANYVAQVNAQIAKDEIEQLEATHAQRLADITDEMDKENSTFASGLSSMLGTADTFGGAIGDSLKTNIEGGFDINWDKVLSNFGHKVGDFGRKALGGAMAAVADIIYGVSQKIEEFVRGIPLIGQTLAPQYKSDNETQLYNQFKQDLANRLNIPQFATGTPAFTGGMALVGENGPEIVELPSATTVYNNRETKNMLNQSSSSANTYNYNNVNIDRSVDMEKISRQLNLQLKYT